MDKKLTRLLPILAFVAGCAAAAELPDLGEPEPRKVWPAVVIGVVAVIADQSINGCGYPCNHFTHAASGAALTVAVSHYYGEKAGWTVGIGFAIGTEIYGKYVRGKEFRAKDVYGRGIGTVGGIWLSRQF